LEVKDFVKNPKAKVTLLDDLSQIDTAQLGEYEVNLKVMGFKVKSKLCIFDDVAPILEVHDVNAESADDISINDFVTNVQDATVTSIEYETSYTFEENKDTEVTIIATDAAGNVTKAKAVGRVVHDTTPPVISGVKDITVKKNATVSYKKDIEVSDDVDENPTLEIDSSAVNLKVLGTYEITYTATDASGNKAVETCNVIVESAELDNVTEAMVNEKADEILATIITEGMTDEEKLSACFKWCYYNITYEETAYETNWVKAAYKGMVLKKGDCSANWGALKCMLNRLGIKNMDIDKTYDGKHAHHKWNLVNLGDGWYHVDSMKNMWNVPIYMWTTEQLMEHSNAHNNTHGFDKSLYPPIK